MNSQMNGSKVPGDLDTDEEAIENLRYFQDDQTGKDAIEGMYLTYRKMFKWSIVKAFEKCLDVITWNFK